jgi:hypothetical protein
VLTCGYVLMRSTTHHLPRPEIKLLKPVIKSEISSSWLKTYRGLGLGATHPGAGLGMYCMQRTVCTYLLTRRDESSNRKRKPKHMRLWYWNWLGIISQRAKIPSALWPVPFSPFSFFRLILNSTRSAVERKIMEGILGFCFFTVTTDKLC